MVPFAATLVATGAAVTTDVRSRRIPNAITCSTAIAGFALAALGFTGHSVAASFVGAMVGLALMIPGYALGGTGAGDVKLMAALGAILGPQRILVAFLYSAIAGGIVALVVAWRRRRLAGTIHSATQVIVNPGVRTTGAIRADTGNRFAFGPAIAVGSLLASLGL